MIKDTHEEHKIELAGNRVHVIDGILGKFDIELQGFGGKTRLIQVTIENVNAQHALSAALFHLNAVEAAVAANIEHRCAGKISGQRRGNPLPLYVGKIAQKVVWS